MPIPKGFRPAVLASVLFLVFPVFTEAQVKLPRWEVGLNSVGSVSDQAPFWLVSNRQGKYLPERYAGSLELGLFSGRDTGRVVDYEYGLELYGRASNNKDLWLHQVYAGVTLYDLVRLRGGMWEEVVGSKEPGLSSGSIIWSGNARPMPKVEIGTPGYVTVPFTERYLEVKGVLAHGWFEEGRYVEDVWLHHKNAYFRAGGDLPVNVYFGLNHYAQWGGNPTGQDVPYPSDLETFWRVFFNRRGDPDKPGTPEVWVMNKIGNSVGSRNHGIDLKMENYSTGVYFQDVFEDGSGKNRRNFPDGLWGAWLRFSEEKKPVQAVVYEFLHTTDQSGRYHDIEGDTLGGNDNYFNHGRYEAGWTLHGYTIGTPLITSTVLDDAISYGTPNNKVVVHHFGFEGYIGEKIKYRNLFTYSINSGTNFHPFENQKEQFSWMLELKRFLEYYGLQVGITLAADVGEMYGDNFGVMVNLVKRGGF